MHGTVATTVSPHTLQMPWRVYAALTVRSTGSEVETTWVNTLPAVLFPSTGDFGPVIHSSVSHSASSKTGNNSISSAKVCCENEMVNLCKVALNAVWHTANVQ